MMWLIKKLDTFIEKIGAPVKKYGCNPHSI